MTLTPDEQQYRARQAAHAARFAAWATEACAAFLAAPREYDRWKEAHPAPRIGASHTGAPNA